MRSGERTSGIRLSDSEGGDLAYALLMDAIDSKGDGALLTLKGKAKTLFGEFGIKLSDEDLDKIEPELKEMLKLAEDRGLWGKIELSVSKGTQTTGTVLKDLGERMHKRRTPGLSDIAARTYLTVFTGPYDLLVSTVKATLVILDRIAKKVSLSVRGKHFHLSSSRRDVVVASMVRRLNSPEQIRGASVAEAASAERELRSAPRRIVFTGRGMTHAARVSKSQEERRGRA